jgi:CRISPR-associated endonuclease Cas1
MQAQATARADGSTCLAFGFGVKVYVDRRHLVIHDGIGADRRTRRYHRVTSRLGRLVVIGHTGYVTLEALRWIRDVKAGFMHLGADGDLITASVAPGPDVAGLRRAQALAATSASGVEIARAVLAAKIAGQRELLDQLPGGYDAVELVDLATETVASADRVDGVLAGEAQAASVYWQAWSTLPIPFSPHAASRVPEHWRTFGQRASLLGNGPRQATNPAGAILNYLYALLEAETVFACHALGLDPGLGVFHTDTPSRASLALDVMEAARPAVDAYVLALLTQRVLDPRQFLETRQGVCRLHPMLASELARTCTLWRTEIAPTVEWVAHTLAEHATSPVPVRTPITQRNSRAAWDKREPGHRRRQSLSEFVTLPDTCRRCGEQLRDRRRRYCETCRADQLREQGPAARQRAGEILARLRAEQRDPAHGGRAAQIRGAKNAAHQAAVCAWTGETPDPAVFRREILPGLSERSIGELAVATGLSAHYCSLIRLGKKVPHARHWDALRRLGHES